jgi:hypothetical protein
MAPRRGGRGRSPLPRRLCEAGGRLVGRDDQGLGHRAPCGLARLQTLIDLVLGTLAQIPITRLDHPGQLVLLARNLFEVLLGELIRPPSEVLPDLRPWLGKHLGTHARALPARGLWPRHPHSSCDRSRRGPCLRRHGHQTTIPAPMAADQRPLYTKSRAMAWAFAALPHDRQLPPIRRIPGAAERPAHRPSGR